MVPQALHTEYSLPGSHERPRNSGATCFMFGSRSRLNFCRSPFSAIGPTKTPVGTTMSYPEVPRAATSLAISSSFELKASSTMRGPFSAVNCSSTSGAS